MLCSESTHRVKVWLSVLSPEPVRRGNHCDSAPVSEAEPPVSRALLKGQGAARVAEPEAGQGPAVVGVVEADYLLRAGG